MDITSINKDLLTNLSASEKEAVFSILKEYSEEGKSKTHQDLLYDDYKEIPVDIETFLTDDRYMGQAWKDNEGNLKIFPFWMNKLKELFPTNIDTKVNTFIASGARGLGKAQPLDSLIYTETGYKKMGELTLKDKVYGEDGKLYSILGIFPQGKKHVVKITFNDNTSVECCDEHLWKVLDKTNGGNRSKWTILTPKEMLNKGLYKNGKWKEARFNIPLCEPLIFEEKSLLIDPYVMGCLLGDGCFSSNQVIGISTTEDEIKNYFKNWLYPLGYKLNLSTKDSYNIVKIKFSNHSNIINEEIKNLGLKGKTSEFKFIPDLYLYNSVENRINLLQGLLDTDGWIAKDGSIIQYYTVSKYLKKDIEFLVRSLGGTVKTHIKQGKYKDPISKKLIMCKKYYELNIKFNYNKIIPFKLLRKRERLFNKNHINPIKSIINIEYIEDKECQCIYIDSPNHLYLTNNLTVTHNTEVIISIMSYMMYKVMCLKNPLEHFHLKPTEKLVFALMNIKLDLAEEIAISKFQNSIKLSPWFLARGDLIGRTNKMWQPKEEYHIDIKIGSQADDVIGLPVYFAFFDEISFIKNQDIDKQKEKAIDMIDTALGGMRTRFSYKGKVNALLCLASSKRSEKSFLEEHIKTKMASEPENVMIIDEPVWNVQPRNRFSKETFKLAVGNKFLVSTILKPEEKPEDFILKGYTKILDVPLSLKAAFIDNMDRALCDYAGISSTELSKYISGIILKDCINDKLENPFVKDVIEVGDAKEDTLQYKDFFDLTKVPKELKSKPLFIHLDMSLTGDKTGIAGVWIKGKKPTVDGNPGKDLFFSTAFAVSVKAPKGRQISFEKNRNFIRWLKEQEFKIKEITSDTFQSADLQQQLKAEGYNCSVLSVDRVDPTSRICIPYQYFKNTLHEQRIEMFHDNLLEQEIVNLERNVNTGKVDHPPKGSKDQSDAICGAVFTASKYAEEYAFDYGEDLEIINDVNKEEEGAEQLVLNLEDELKKMGPALGSINKIDLFGNNYSTMYEDEDMPVVEDGSLIW